MLMEGLDVYLPLVDDHGVDCVIKKEDGTFIEVQIKARSSEVTDGDAALFAAITHELTPNFYFVFYSERLDLTVISVFSMNCSWSICASVSVSFFLTSARVFP